MTIKHLSFDLWLTLIKSNPVFKIKRAEYFYDRYNPRKMEFSELTDLIRDIDRKCDDCNEKTGEKISATAMYSMVLAESGNDNESATIEILEDIRLNINMLFLEYRPFLLNDGIINTLENLKNDGYTMNLASNTGFIEGDVVINALKILNLYDFFDFFIFSDEVSASKPSSIFYTRIFDHLKNNMNKREVLHIGDNYNADFSGATDYGFEAFHIPDPDYTYYDIKRAIYEKNIKT